MNKGMYFSNSARKSSSSYEDRDKLCPQEQKIFFVDHWKFLMLEVLFAKSNQQGARKMDAVGDSLI